MTLRGVDILLTYQCNLECDHCFVWGGPQQAGTLTLPRLAAILDQAVAAGVTRIFLEGGEPGLYYSTLLAGACAAKARDLWVGIVSNGYWALSLEDARAWLAPFAGRLDELEISRDLFHWSAEDARLADNAAEAAAGLGIPMATLSIGRPEAGQGAATKGQLPGGEWSVMYRGRAAAKLANLVTPRPWATFDTCPYEDLRDPDRVHVDPLGFVHICQGITIGNVFERPLAEIFATYAPDAHPIVGPLLAGGPAELARRFGPAGLTAGYADACHLCYETRRGLRARFPEVLGPGQMYGERAAERR